MFAGYKVPHPLEHKFVLRVQTTNDYSPNEALTNAIQDLLQEVKTLEDMFKVGTASGHSILQKVDTINFLNLVCLVQEAVLERQEVN